MEEGEVASPVTVCKVFRYEDTRRNPSESACVSIPEVSLTPFPHRYWRSPPQWAWLKVELEIGIESLYCCCI